VATQLTNVTVVVNNDTQPIVVNSLKYTEGLGDQKIHIVSAGGGAIQQVYANDLETAYSAVSFDLRSTPENIENIKGWKRNGNSNGVQIFGTAGGTDFSRTFAHAALTLNYDVEIGVDAVISVEFMTDSAV
jgi:hypothetical protein